jgi:hypothetical protein
MRRRTWTAVLLTGALAVALVAILMPGGGSAAGQRGTRAATQTPAATHFQTAFSTFGTGATTFFGPVSGALKGGLAITSLTVANTGPGAVGSVEVDVVHGTLGRGGCAALTGVEKLTSVIVVSDTVHLDFPEPLVASSSETWCSRVVFGGPALEVTVVGFTF